MKANLHKSWWKLPPSERDSLQKAMEDEVNRIVDDEEKEMQVIWMKLACIILHNTYGFGEKRMLRFIASWKRIYRKHSRSEAEWIETEMRKLFPKDGFPEERIKEMKEL